MPPDVDFMETLPRLPTGKLYKKPLRDRIGKGTAAASSKLRAALRRSLHPGVARQDANC